MTETEGADTSRRLELARTQLGEIQAEDDALRLENKRLSSDAFAIGKEITQVGCRVNARSSGRIQFIHNCSLLHLSTTPQLSARETALMQQVKDKEAVIAQMSALLQAAEENKAQADKVRGGHGTREEGGRR